MEEAKHRFVDARGISIGAQLAERDWIPAVTHSRIEILGEALLEEDCLRRLHGRGHLKNLLYTARMDCYVVRDGRPVQVAARWSRTATVSWRTATRRGSSPGTSGSTAPWNLPGEGA